MSRRGLDRRRRRPVDIQFRRVTTFIKQFRAAENGPVIWNIGPPFSDQNTIKECCDS